MQHTKAKSYLKQLNLKQSLCLKHLVLKPFNFAYSKIKYFIMYKALKLV